MALSDAPPWRFLPGAVLTGIGTVRDDDPRLDVRLVPTARQPLRVVIDSRLEISPAARVLQAPGRALVYTASDDAARTAALTSDTVEVARVPADAQGKTDLAALLADLARREVNELHVEAGEKLNGSLLRAGLVDELVVYIAPRLLGPGRGIAAFGPLASLADSLNFEFVDVERVGADLRLRLRPPGRADF
jgi:diaminohydroxyphosphoribosylaminopyrimidine deaminase / 5-amino-6-(5-phosphoribosylamino)uracil reductase